jgi:DNA-binding NarL/FixJ family response regulator
MHWVVEGLFDKEIAEKLGISASTVRKHLRDIFQKLHAGSRTEAARKWREPTRPGISFS